MFMLLHSVSEPFGISAIRSSWDTNQLLFSKPIWSGWSPGTDAIKVDFWILMQWQMILFAFLLHYEGIFQNVQGIRYWKMVKKLKWEMCCPTCSLYIKNISLKFMDILFFTSSTPNLIRLTYRFFEHWEKMHHLLDDFWTEVNGGACHQKCNLHECTFCWKWYII